MPITKPLRDVQMFAQNASNWLSAHPERTKFSYALTRVLKRLEPSLIALGEAQEDAMVEFCAVDDKDVLQIDENRYRFTRDGMAAKNAKIRALLNEPVEFEPFYAPEPAEPLSIMEVVAFEGFVLEASSEPDDEPQPHLTNDIHLINQE